MKVFYGPLALLVEYFCHFREDRPMVVRFSKHSLQRCTKRFGHAMGQLVDLVENGIRDEHGAKSSRGSRWVIEGFIGRRAARVVLATNATGEFTIVTAMWL